MKPLELPLLADENIHPRVVQALREQGKDVSTVLEVGLSGRPDTEVLEKARGDGRVVVTHDGDFGRLAVSAGQGHAGIVYLRPGHIDPTMVLQSLDAIERTIDAVDPGFIIVAEHRAATVRIRLRSAEGASRE